MEDEKDILLSINDMENQINELRYRLYTQEEQTKAINDLSLNVRELAVTMKGMVKEQGNLGERITRLERVPGTRYESLILAFISALAGAVCGLFFKIF